MGADVNEYACTKIVLVAVRRLATMASVHPPLGEKYTLMSVAVATDNEINSASKTLNIKNRVVDRL